MTKLTTYSWSDDIEPYLEKKFGDIREFGIFKKKLLRVPYGTSHYRVAHENQWKERNYPKLKEYQKDPLPNYGLNQIGMDFYKTVEGSKWFGAIDKAYDTAKDGAREAERLYPNLDFWNEVLVDMLDINNGCLREVDWKEIRSELSTENKWAGEIIDYILLKFPNSMKLEVSW